MRVDQDEDSAEIDAAEELPGIGGLVREPHPEDIHRCAELDRLEAGRQAHVRASAVGADDEVGPQLALAGGRLDAHAADAIAVEEESADPGRHFQAEVRVRARLFGQEVEEVPLRHERDELAGDREMPEVGECEGGVADLTGDDAGLLVRQREKLIEKTDLLDDLEGGWVNGDADAGAGEERPSIMPAGPPPATRHWVGWVMAGK